MHSLNSTNPCRILVADDDPVVRHWLAATLETDGYEVVITSNGREAYRALMTDAAFAAAIFDVSMPCLDGHDLIRHMRTEKRLMKIPVLMITAETAINTVASCLSAGATMVLTKPFIKSRLQQTLRTMLGDMSFGKLSGGPTASSMSERSAFPARSRSIVDRDDHEAGVMGQVVDFSILLDLADPHAGEEDIVIELIDLYLDNTARQVSEIKSAVAANKPQLLKESAHALKGSSLTIGARALGRTCEEIEREQLGSPALKELLAKLESVFTATAEAFQLERNNRLVPVAA